MNIRPSSWPKNVRDSFNGSALIFRAQYGITENEAKFTAWVHVLMGWDVDLPYDFCPTWSTENKPWLK